MFPFQMGAFVHMSLDVHGHLLVSEQHQMCFQWQKSDFHGPTRKIKRKKNLSLTAASLFLEN